MDKVKKIYVANNLEIPWFLFFGDFPYSYLLFLLPIQTFPFRVEIPIIEVLGELIEISSTHIVGGKQKIHI